MSNRLFGAVFVGVLVFLGGFGCSPGGSQPPTPLPLEQIPAEMKKAFTKAPAEVKEMVEKLNAGLEAKEYAVSYETVQNLCNLSIATKEQRLVSIRSMFTIQALLQAAQAQGDQKAAAVLSEQRRLK